MDKLSSKNIKWIRNIIMIAEMIVIFTLWLYIPPIIKNNDLVHVGNEKYGSSLGFLLMALFPLIGLLHQVLGKWDDKEIHTDDVEEKLRSKEKQEIASLKVQILLSILGFVIGCIGVVLAIFEG